MVTIKNVSKVFKNGKNEFSAIKNVSFDVEEGRSIAIIGKSGSGKSTLMHAMSGLDRATTGQISIDDIDVCNLKNSKVDQFRNKYIGFIFQTFFLQGNENVLENVMLPLEIAGVPLKSRKNIAMEALQKVDMANKAKEKSKNLSGGEKQRVCIARAIVNSPKIIFADEPTGNLDSENGKKVIDLLFSINKDLKSTLFIVTHEMELADKCEDQITLKDGEIIRIEKTVDKIKQNKED